MTDSMIIKALYFDPYNAVYERRSICVERSTDGTLTLDYNTLKETGSTTLMGWGDMDGPATILDESFSGHFAVPNYEINRIKS